MKRSPELKMNRWDLLAAALVLALSAVLFFRLSAPSAAVGELTVSVSADGEVLERVSLAQLRREGARTYTANGYTLTLVPEERDGVWGVRVEKADCPNQDCVHTGRIHRAGQSIVCLPARIVIELVGAGGDVDVVVG